MLIKSNCTLWKEQTKTKILANSLMLYVCMVFELNKVVYQVGMPQIVDIIYWQKNDEQNQSNLLILCSNSFYNKPFIMTEL